jgi:hypothetical protein
LHTRRDAWNARYSPYKCVRLARLYPIFTANALARMVCGFILDILYILFSSGLSELGA